MRKAEQAIQQNNDDAARAALTRYNDIIKQSQRYQQQQEEQEQLVVTMRSALRQLEAKLSEVETTIDLLVARKRNAALQQRVFDALNKTGGQKDKERADRARDAVMEAEARARAMADLHSRDIDVQLDQLSQEQVVEHQLNNLKAKRRARSEPALLHEGNAQGSPLLRPQPQQSEPSKKRAESTPEQNVPAPPTPLSDSKELDLAQLKRLLEE
jgi:phage shock protein A